MFFLLDLPIFVFLILRLTVLDVSHTRLEVPRHQGFVLQHSSPIRRSLPQLKRPWLDNAVLRHGPQAILFPYFAPLSLTLTEGSFEDLVEPRPIVDGVLLLV